MRIVSAVTVALLTFTIGCAGNRNESGSSKAASPPSDYRAKVAAYIVTKFFDPYSMRDVKISEPFQGSISTKKGWVVCVELNARNRVGEYTGLKRTAFLIHKGDVVDSDEGAAVCSGYDVKPWPEMEHLEDRTRLLTH